MTIWTIDTTGERTHPAGVDEAVGGFLKEYMAGMTYKQKTMYLERTVINIVTAIACENRWTKSNTKEITQRLLKEALHEVADEAYTTIHGIGVLGTNHMDELIDMEKKWPIYFRNSSGRMTSSDEQEEDYEKAWKRWKNVRKPELENPQIDEDWQYTLPTKEQEQEDKDTEKMGEWWSS